MCVCLCRDKFNDIFFLYCFLGFGVCCYYKYLKQKSSHALFFVFCCCFISGTGKKGGMLSIFLMGCYDKISKLWKTVTKVHSGLDDKTMDDLKVCIFIFYFFLSKFSADSGFMLPIGTGFIHFYV